MRSLTAPKPKLQSKPRRLLRHSPLLLCVDDDPGILIGLNRSLTYHGARVLRGHHGMQGYYLACKQRPDVIITDLRMPLGDGQFFLDCVWNNRATRHIPIIVLSGLDGARLEEIATDPRVACVFRKPAPLEELIAAVRALTGRRWIGKRS